MSVSLIASGLLLTAILFLVLGSLLNLSSNPHWFVRGWDFPRVQIIVVGWMLAAAYMVVRYFCGADEVVAAWPVLTLTTALTLWHGFRILPYTPLFAKQSAATPSDQVADHREDSSTVRMVMTNVEMDNDQYDLWMRTMRAVEPDLLLIVEIDQNWVDALSSFIDEYPHRVIQPQDNCYGMMLLSKMPIESHQVRYVVQDDIPSIDASIRMDDTTLIRFIGVHPRPPEPIRDTDATARDAELTLWGQELTDEEAPVIIGGDLNDVAWSQTTRLFLRVSGLLDPRRGRGFFHSFHAGHWYLRFPLDHFFHSPHFTISKIERLANVGSDHFPILVDVRYAPPEKSAHEVLVEKESDKEEVESRLDRADADSEVNGEAFDGDPSNGEREVSPRSGDANKSRHGF